MDEIIVFDPLSEQDLLAIARLMIAQVNETLAEKGIELVADDAIYKWLVETSCAERSLGARPLRRAIQRHCEDALAERVIQGQLARPRTHRGLPRRGRQAGVPESKRRRADARLARIIHGAVRCNGGSARRSGHLRGFARSVHG